uniref:EF-hand domain-containing protein n=1 Tax=Amphiprion percula TaxID=161767 RepID=A0A3P8S4U0_AMPPE
YRDLSVRNDTTTEQPWRTTMSTVAEILTSLKVLFTEYAGKSGNKETLSKRELAEIKAEIKDFFDLLDEDGDGEVDFKEFVNFALCQCILQGKSIPMKGGSVFDPGIITDSPHT